MRFSGGYELEPVELTIQAFEPPAEVVAFLADAEAEVDRVFAMGEGGEVPGYFPSDHESVFFALAALRHRVGEGASFCEWGSGLGVVAGLAAYLGYRACGIELEPRLVLRARDLLARHGLTADVLQGSFLPEAWGERVRLPPGEEARTILDAPRGEVDVEIDDFDVIFAFPWPAEEEMFHELFLQHACDGAVLVTYGYHEGVRTKRKRRSP